MTRFITLPTITSFVLSLPLLVLLVGVLPAVEGKLPGGKAVTLPLHGAVIHRPPHFIDRDRFLALPEAAVVVGKVPAEPQALANAFAAACEVETNRIESATEVSILTTGPRLDSPDTVVAQRLVRQGQRLELDIAYTSARARGVQLRRNVQWRPLVQVPVNLPPGQYELQVTWTAVEKLPDGKPMPALKTVTQKRTFTIAGKQ